MALNIRRRPTSKNNLTSTTATTATATTIATGSANSAAVAAAAADAATSSPPPPAAAEIDLSEPVSEKEFHKALPRYPNDGVLLIDVQRYNAAKVGGQILGWVGG